MLKTLCRWSDSGWACGHMSLCWIWEKTQQWTRNLIRAVKLGHPAAECLCGSTFACHTCYKTHLYTRVHDGVRWEAPSASPGAADTLVYIQDRSQSVCAARCYCHLPFKAPRSVALSLSPSVNTFLWVVCNTFYQLCLWLTCVFVTFLCFTGSVAA